VKLRHLALSLIAAGALLASIAGCGAANEAPQPTPDADVTPPADSIGERIFLDTRFSEYFATHMTGINNPLPVGDPAVATVPTTNGSLPGPFAGQSINCRSCHFVTEFQGVGGAGNRTYSDFTTRSEIPKPMNGFDHTPRNSSQMVDSFTARSGPVFLHHDGEFISGIDLVKGTMTARNFGWLPTEYQQAVAHIARVIREDNGSDQLAADRTNGLSYSTLFLGTDSRITPDLQLPVNERLDVAKATDDQVLDEIALCINQYMEDLLFARDEYGRYTGSPYDNFIRVNHLPQQPLAGQTKADYNQKLLKAVLAIKNPIYISDSDGSYKYHSFSYQFGAKELQGLVIFLTAATNATDGSQHAGNCAACHQAPDFSDFLFHNTGTSQAEYDGVHGNGAFATLAVPSLAQRNANFNAYLPVSTNHPNASESFRRAASADNPNYADLGLWNVYLNPDMPKPQSALSGVVCATGKDCSVDNGLASTIAQFKTPVLRDLADSEPYFHNGAALDLEAVINQYIKMSALARQEAMRNAPPEFKGMSISGTDKDALIAFLMALTEDYDDA
jgi:cytochrome c peroxidase